MKIKSSYERPRGIDAVILLTAIFLVIVLLLHHGSYTINYLGPLHRYHINKFLQKFAVGGFLFLSGFKLTKSKISNSSREFLVNRFFRVYLLYLLALIVFSFTAYPDLNNGIFPSWSNFILHSFCIQSLIPHFFQQDYNTIWFVSVLFFCYGFFLLTRRLLDKLHLFLIILFIVIVAISLIRHLASLYEVNIFHQYLDTWLAFFSLGMVYSKNQKRINRLNTKLFACSSCISFILLIALYNATEIEGLLIYTIERILILASTLSLYFIQFKIHPHIYVSRRVSSFLKWISYSSFCVFLFHRSIWNLLVKFWSDESFYQSIFILVLGIPIILILSYRIQVTYNQVITNIRQRISL
ncbi:MAG: acyltransferase family protein [Xenococcaceae cyanobacterium MO_167.B27]|nr:acyltransferase family protein [Xenococcaceae cyanobacterium MO_167.B27]